MIIVVLKYFIFVSIFILLHFGFYKFHDTKFHKVYIGLKLLELILAVFTIDFCKKLFKSELFIFENYLVNLIVFFVFPLVVSKFLFYVKYRKLV